MKNKKSIYVLAPLTLLIWGLIFYKVYNAVNKKNAVELQMPYVVNDTGSNNYSDTFSIANNYSDPFIKGIIVSPKNTLAKTTTIPVKKTEPTPDVWPGIIYAGTIKSNKSNKTLAMLNVNGEDFLVYQGMNVKDVQVKKIMPDSVLLVYKKKLKYFKK